MTIIFTGVFTLEEKESIEEMLIKDNLNIDEYIRNRDFLITKNNDIIEVIRKNS